MRNPLTYNEISGYNVPNGGDGGLLAPENYKKTCISHAHTIIFITLRDGGLPDSRDGKALISVKR